MPPSFSIQTADSVWRTKFGRPFHVLLQKAPRNFVKLKWWVKVIKLTFFAKISITIGTNKGVVLFAIQQMQALLKDYKHRFLLVIIRFKGHVLNWQYWEYGKVNDTTKYILQPSNLNSTFRIIRLKNPVHFRTGSSFISQMLYETSI